MMMRRAESKRRWRRGGRVMFSLLAAIGITLYLLLRVGFENNSIAANKARYNKRIQEFDNFCNKYSATREEAEEVQKMILSASPDLADIKKELEEVTGIFPTHSMIKWGYLAKQGKVMSRDAFTSAIDTVLTTDHDLWYWQPRWRDNYTEQELREARAKFLKWYDKELQAHGMEWPLMFCKHREGDLVKGTGYAIYHTRYARSVQECTEASGTVFFWYPTRDYMPAGHGYVLDD